VRCQPPPIPPSLHLLRRKRPQRALFASGTQPPVHDNKNLSPADIRHRGERALLCARNLRSAYWYLQSDFIDTHLHTSIAAGHTAGPSASPSESFPDIVCYSVGAVPKKSGNVHLFYFWPHYITVDDALNMVMCLGKGAPMAKINTRHAFHPEDHLLLGIYGRQQYYDLVLPSGLRSAPLSSTR